MTKQEINDYIKIWISILPIYGEFTLMPYDPILNHAKEILGREHPEIEKYNKGEEVLQFLVNEGFAVFRHDIIKDEKTFAQLNDRGRKLKELGSIENYFDWERKEKEESNRIKELQVQSLVSNINSAKFQKQMVIANTWIAIGAIVAVFYYVLEIQLELKKQHPHFYKAYFLYIFWLEFGILLTAIIIWLIYYNPAKSKENKEDNERK